MAYIDCFNGDADGICALTQLRLAEPLEAQLITGVKRDISLLKQAVVTADDVVTVLDVSLDKNRQALVDILNNGARVLYIDHHFAGDVPEHKNLTTLINTTPDVCTSLLVNQHLKSKYQQWAVVGVFGDNMKKSAHGLAKSLSLSDKQLTQLEQLGVYLNYNGYGSHLGDLYFHPADLFRRTSAFNTPFAFMQEDNNTFETLAQGYQQDMSNAQQVTASFEQAHAAVYILPDQAWARRVSGVYGNDLANQFVDRAHAVVTQKPRSIGVASYVVSVRAPLNNKQGADKICRQFPSGGGRAAAAGINDLPTEQLPRFIDAFSQYYSSN